MNTTFYLLFSLISSPSIAGDLYTCHLTNPKGQVVQKNYYQLLVDKGFWGTHASLFHYPDDGTGDPIFTKKLAGGKPGKLYTGLPAITFVDEISVIDIESTLYGEWRWIKYQREWKLGLGLISGALEDQSELIFDGLSRELLLCEK